MGIRHPTLGPIESVEDLGADVKNAPAIHPRLRLATQAEKPILLQGGYVRSSEICVPR